MIKNVDLLKVEKYSLFKISILTIYIIFPSLVVIILTFLDYYNSILVILAATVVIIIFQFVLMNAELYQSGTTTNHETIQNLVIICITLVSAFGAVLVPLESSALTLAVFIYSLFFILINSEVYLQEIKKYLYSNFIKRKKIKLFSPRGDIKDEPNGNFWPPQDPFAIKFLDLQNKPIKESDNTYISIRGHVANDLDSAFSPIHSIITCKKLLGNSNERQKYFNIIYAILIIINFFYFFSALFIAKILYIFYNFEELIYPFIAFLIIINLVATIYAFIKHLAITKCDEKIICSELINSTLMPIVDNDINKFYLTFSLGSKRMRVDHNKELEELEKTNGKLAEKLDNIYQIVTPILLLSQVTLSIAFTNFFILKGH